MRVAVISDVHGNARALEAVLATLEHDRTDAIWCLGDTVGYGALALGLLDGSLVGGLAPAGSTVSFAEHRWLLNPGSVGQPRDGDARAAYLVLDLEQRVAEFHRVEYDVAGTQREIREAGLPEVLAARLERGE